MSPRTCSYDQFVEAHTTPVRANYFSTINKREDWDRILGEEYKMAPSFLKSFLAFSESLFRYDVFFVSANGFFLGSTNLCFLQAQFLKPMAVTIVFGLIGSTFIVLIIVPALLAIRADLASLLSRAKNVEQVRSGL